MNPAVLEDIYGANLFDFIIIEADGAARRSLKTCASREPVVPLFSDLIVSIVGLDVVAKPLSEEWVFRSGHFSRITGLELMREVTESSIASILLHDMSSITVTGQETMKIAFLNKADNVKAMISGERIADILEKSGSAIFDRIVIGELWTDPVIHQCRVLQHRRTQ